MVVKHTHYRKIRTRGSALVEFGLVALLFVTLFLAILDFGYLGFRFMQMSNATREAARLASMGRTTAQVRQTVNARCAPLTVTTAIEYSVDGGSTYAAVTDNGDVNAAPTFSMVRVTVTNSFRPLIGLIPWMRGRSVTARAEFGRE